MAAEESLVSTAVQHSEPFSHELPPLPDGTALDVAPLPPAASCDDVCLGGRVWVAAPALCGWMSSVADQFAQTSCLELGAGTGACGLYAAGLGASRVVLTDGGPSEAPLLQLMADNAERNRARLPAGSRVEVASLTWGCEPSALPAGPFDWVLGSDVTWGSDHDNHASLCTTLRALLQRDQPRRPRVALAMEHGLPVPAAEADGTYRDETLEQVREAAAARGLRVVPLAQRGPLTDEFCDLRWPASAFSAFTERTTSDVFIVEVVLEQASLAGDRSHGDVIDI